jgi:hypothetical protein
MEETKVEIDNLNKDMSVKKQAAAYLLSIDPETERLQVKINYSSFPNYISL